MDPDTGYIHVNPEVKTMREEEARKLVPIPKVEEEEVINMNRQQRRAWARRQKKAQR